MNTIFKNNAKKYFECGIPVIPLNGKIPIVTGWHEWSIRMQTEDELDVLIERYPNANIGAVMGLWATALDIDTDDQAVLATVPYSPFRRRGKKGFVAIYKKNGLQNNPGREYPVELLNVGRQIVLPPSIHPDTGEPYVWIGEESVSDGLEFPEITASQIKMIEGMCLRKNIFRKSGGINFQEGTDPVCLTDQGRNNYLTRVAYAMACDGESVDSIVDRLIYLDEKEHETPWFSDPKEPHRGRNPKATAHKMATRAVAKSEKLGARHDRSSEPFVLDLPTTKINIKAPKARGIMGLFQEYCELSASGNQDALGLGGAISLMSAICSNRFKTSYHQFEIWPNLYVFNLANSGYGKETAQKALRDLLFDTDLLGAATYKSGSSIIMGLVEQRVRLDIIDECAMLLKAMCAREDYKSDMVDVLSSLYTASSGYFAGFTSKGDGKNFGACWNPCVNILGSTTPAGFKNSVNKEMAAKGLMPRCLTFWQKDVGEFKEYDDTNQRAELFSEIKRLVRMVLSEAPETEEVQMNILDGKGSTITRFHPENIPISRGAIKAIVDIRKKYFYEGKGDESFEGPFKNRFAENVVKIALHDAIGLGLREIGLDSVEWAYEVVKYQWENSKELYELANAGTQTEKDSIEILKFIENNGTVKKSKLYSKFRRIPKFTYDQLVMALLESELIEKINIETKGRPAAGYRFIKKFA
jgi:hypothetical protein